MAQFKSTSKLNNAPVFASYENAKRYAEKAGFKPLDNTRFVNSNNEVKVLVTFGSEYHFAQG
jgi:hypothetical protein